MIFVLGLCASLMVILLSLAIHRKNVVIFSAMISIFTIAQYALLDKWTTVALAIITLLYALTVPFEKFFKFLTSKYITLALAVLYTGAFFTMNGITFNIDAIAYLASVSGVLMMTLKNPLHIKWIMLANGIMWSIYQIYTGAYGQLFGEAFFIAGVIVSLIILYKAKSQNKSLYNIPELSFILRQKLVAVRS